MWVELPLPTDPDLEATPQDQENDPVANEPGPGGPGAVAGLRFPLLGVDLLDREVLLSRQWLESTTHVVRARYSVDLATVRVSSRITFLELLDPPTPANPPPGSLPSATPPSVSPTPTLLPPAFLRYLALLLALAKGFLVPVGGVAGPLEVVLECLVDGPAEVM